MSRPTLSDRCEEHDEPILQRIRDVTTKHGDETCSETREYVCGCSSSVWRVGAPEEWVATSNFIVKG